MTQKETKIVIRLFKLIKRSGYWFPETIFKPLHGVVSMWAPELVILRNKKREILLTKYEGEFAKGVWHIPGGYNRWNESIQETCSRIAKRELGFDVSFRKVLDAYKWKISEHPYGRPLSLYVFCDSKKRIVETNEMKFFPMKKLPNRLMPPHRRFIQNMLSLK